MSFPMMWRFAGQSLSKSGRSESGDLLYPANEM